ncbi:MAG: 3-dehydroquinate synthase [Ignavibacteriaceae bacterium]|nr:3-dehydroquinate synthase [Ignavibacteriaceae bacterium]
MNMITIPVETPSASYKVNLYDGAFEPLLEYLAEKRFKTYFLVDANVYRHHSNAIHELSGFSRGEFRTLIMKPSESMKNLKSVERVLSFLQGHGADRKSVLVIIGGGILGDIGAFAASIYMRGIRFIQVPTTLLSIIDSSVGGKTGVNFGDRKNFIGTFAQPESVWSGLKLLKTLPRNELKAGWGEMVKYAFLYDREFFWRINEFSQMSHRQEELHQNEIMAECIAIKARIVAADEKESGPRKMLNLGHTFAHAIESLSHYKIKHGYAVGAGLLYANIISCELGLISSITRDENQDLIRTIDFPPLLGGLDAAKLWELMKSDKKSDKGQVRLVLMKENSPPVYDIPVNENLITRVIEYCAGKYY